MKALVIGHNVRHIACSASRAGHEVMAADCYCDLDLRDTVSIATKLDCDPSISGDLVRVARELIETALCSFSPEVLVLGPGLEDMEVKEVRVLNNPARKTAQVSDKLWLARWLEKAGYPTVTTWLPDGGEGDWREDWREGENRPLMVKPRRGAGGWKNRLAFKDRDLQGLGDDFVVQEWVEGEPASVSVIGDGEESVALAVNEQMIGLPWLGAEGFRYCGNISPLESSKLDFARVQEVKEMAEEIVAQLALVGSNGVDFLLTQRGPVVVEVNPRFQGSLDAVELSTGINIFQAHLRSFDGMIPQRPKPRKTAGRAVLFAEENLKIKDDLRHVTEWIADVPKKDSHVGKYEPFVSILAVGGDRNEVMNLLQSRRNAIFQRCCH